MHPIRTTTARAFLARGARSVLVSLWNVSDEATELLMRRFYMHWLRDPDKPDKAEALKGEADGLDRLAERGYANEALDQLAASA